MDLAAASFSSSHVHELLSKTYPDTTLRWVHRASWKLHPALPLTNLNMARRPGGRDPAKVEAIRASIRAGKHMAPIVTVRRDDGTHDIADGFHRALAFQKERRSTIPAYVGSGLPEKGPWRKSMHAAKLNLARTTDLFNPSQRRAPAGGPQGGQWTAQGGAAPTTPPGQKGVSPQLAAWAAKQIGHYPANVNTANLRKKWDNWFRFLTMTPAQQKFIAGHAPKKPPKKPKKPPIAQLPWLLANDPVRQRIIDLAVATAGGPGATGIHVGPHHWKHGWIPLTPEAWASHLKRVKGWHAPRVRRADHFGHLKQAHGSAGMKHHEAFIGARGRKGIATIPSRAHNEQVKHLADRHGLVGHGLNERSATDLEKLHGAEHGLRPATARQRTPGRVRTEAQRAGLATHQGLHGTQPPGSVTRERQRGIREQRKAARMASEAAKAPRAPGTATKAGVERKRLLAELGKAGGDNHAQLQRHLALQHGETAGGVMAGTRELQAKHAQRHREGRFFSPGMEHQHSEADAAKAFGEVPTAARRRAAAEAMNAGHHDIASNAKLAGHMERMHGAIKGMDNFSALRQQHEADHQPNGFQRARAAGRNLNNHAHATEGGTIAFRERMRRDRAKKAGEKVGAAARERHARIEGERQAADAAAAAAGHERAGAGVAARDAQGNSTRAKHLADQVGKTAQHQRAFNFARGKAMARHLQQKHGVAAPRLLKDRKALHAREHGANAEGIMREQQSRLNQARAGMRERHIQGRAGRQQAHVDAHQADAIEHLKHEHNLTPGGNREAAIALHAKEHSADTPIPPKLVDSTPDELKGRIVGENGITAEQIASGSDAGQKEFEQRVQAAMASGVKEKSKPKVAGIDKTEFVTFNNGERFMVRSQRKANNFAEHGGAGRLGALANERLANNLARAMGVHAARVHEGKFEGHRANFQEMLPGHDNFAPDVHAQHMQTVEGKRIAHFDDVAQNFDRRYVPGEGGRFQNPLIGVGLGHNVMNLNGHPVAIDNGGAFSGQKSGYGRGKVGLASEADKAQYNQAIDAFAQQLQANGVNVASMKRRVAAL